MTTRGRTHPPVKPLAAAAGITLLIIIGCATGYTPDHTPHQPTPWYTTQP